jgi:hypothetical protein
MKFIKSLIITGSVVLALGALQAKAQFTQLPFPLAHQFEPLNLSLVLSKQQALNSNATATATVSTVQNIKLTTPALLGILAQAYNMTWPTGAKLAIDFANNGDIYVVDKTGTNAIFDVSQGVYDTNNNNYVYFYFQTDGYSVISGKQDSRALIADKTTSTFQITFTLEVEVNGFEEYSLMFAGIDTDVFQLTSANVASQTDHMTVTGDGIINGSDAEVTGTISGSGSWKAH